MPRLVRSSLSDAYLTDGFGESREPYVVNVSGSYFELLKVITTDIKTTCLLS